ncbi:MAG TPA: sulfatase, partial [Planctomycetota bacterium]|nr:sulfatase [Planctomycetota bacterium]
MPPRHVLLVTVDTLRADHLSAYLYLRPTTSLAGLPAFDGTPLAHDIDGLADAGVVFAHAYAPRGQTFPSLATLMTGVPPFAHGAVQNRDVLDASATTLAEAFAERGFVTLGVTTNELLVEASGIAQGFERFAHFGDGDKDRAATEELVLLVRRARAESPERPIFAWLHLMGPHLPYDPQPLGGVDPAAHFTDPGYAGPADGSREFLDAAYRNSRPLTPEDRHHVVALYDGEVARVNHLVALLLQAVAAEPGSAGGSLLDETLVVFTADHGEELAERHGYWAHSRSVHDSVLHVPLVLRHPPSLTGRRVLAETVELQDVAPTLLEWFGIPVPEPVRGRSLLPLVDTYVERPFASRPAFGQWNDRIFTARDARWRLVWNPDGVEPDDPPAGPYPVPPLALYDHEHDPREQRDVAAEHPRVVERLQRAIVD